MCLFYARRKKSDGSTTRERMIRQEKHKTHTICLLATGLIRNRYINNKELQVRSQLVTSCCA